MTLLTILTPVIAAFIISLIFRKLNMSGWIDYLAPCLIVTLLVFLYSSTAGGFYENPFSLFENSRVIFLSFLGAGFADFTNSMREELSRET